MEKIKLKPPHRQKTTIIEQYGMDKHVPEQHCQHLPRINYSTDDESIGDKLDGIGIDTDRAEECAYVGV